MRRADALDVLSGLLGQNKRQLDMYENAPYLAKLSPVTLERLKTESAALEVAIQALERDENDR